MVGVQNSGRPEEEAQVFRSFYVTRNSGNSCYIKGTDVPKMRTCAKM